MISKVIIVHGFNWTKEEAEKKPEFSRHWFLWLKKELEKR